MACSRKQHRDSTHIYLNNRTLLTGLKYTRNAIFVIHLYRNLYTVKGVTKLH